MNFSDFEHDDGYMICCDRCLVWQHVDCMGIDRSNIPDEYLCERCRPRRVDRQRARALQMRKREELLNSDTSSDTSSTSSADTDVGVNATQKKRSLPQQQSVPRRSKSDAPAQVRRLNNNNNNNNNNNVAKRQRRDSHPRQSSAVRKKEVAAKRGPGKRKAKRRMSVEDKEEEAQDSWGSSNMAPLRQWIERYEEAVTNHYSPELRARISSIKVNGTHSDLRQSNMNVIATGKCRLNVHSNSLRFLVATVYLPPNTPVVELRGKYMLSTQHRPQHPQGRQHAQRPGPFVFFYRLPRDGTEVCVDTRTYGNDARFVRRSCRPNAEVKHCIEKGTLHLYIVTTTAIEKNAEITIKHEQHDLLLSPNPNSTALPVVCACSNPRECQIATASQLNRRGSNGALVENADGRERRRRGRRNTVCEETEPAPAVPSTSVTQSPPTVTTVSSTVTAPPPRRTVTTTVATITTRQVPKEEPSATVQQPQTSPGISQSTPPETKKDKKKMTREERKMEAIMKAFERLEKAEQRKQEVQARNAQRKESSGTHSDNEDNHSTTGQSKNRQASSERPLRRKRRKGRARTTSTSQSQSNRRTRLNSAESDVSSGDESNSLQSPPLLGGSQVRPPSQEVPYSSHLHTPAKNTSNEVASTGPSGHQGIPTAAGLLLALANSNAPPGPPSSPPLQQPTPVKSPTCDSGASSSSQSSTPSTPLSSACLLVAAAVGPLAPGLKFPKTKKALMNEWLKESPDLPPPQANVIPQVSPLSALPTASTLPNTMNSALCIRQSDFPLPSTGADPSAEFLSQSYAAKSLATLVQAANSVSGICDSPPQQQRRQQQQTVGGNNSTAVNNHFNNINNNNNNNNNNNAGGCPASTGSAKKRWLRQAISEECDSPNSRPDSPPALLETVAPPKKRRIARESLSSDNYTPPTTPTMLLPEAAPNSRSLCPNEDEYTEHAQSPVVEQVYERHYEESVSVKEESSIEPEETIAREKLSIDIPRSDFCTKRDDKAEISDVVKTEVKSPVIKTEDTAATMGEEEDVQKCEEADVKADYSSAIALHSDTKVFAKDDLRAAKDEVLDLKTDSSHLSKVSVFTKKEETQTVAKGTVEIIDQNEPDTEMEEFSSPPWYQCDMESDAILKQRVAEMQLEFGGGIAEIVNISDNGKPDCEKKPCEEEASGKCEETEEKSDDNTSIDEFDVEAQMKKITGDDGNDYQEKIETSSERDKSMDGIEGLMESSKEDSDSEDKDMDDTKYCESAFKLFNVSHEDEPPLKEELETTKITEQQVLVTSDDTKETKKDEGGEPAKTAEPSSTFIASSEESVFESTSSNVDTKPVADPPKIFHSIPPLSERIRKKTTDSAATSKTPSLGLEAAIIESTINMDTAEGSKNGEQKSIELSTALRELLEAKLDDEPTEAAKDDADNKANNAQPIVQLMTLNSPERTTSTDTPNPSPARPEARPEEAPAKEEETKPKEIKRLKDPRTVVPNNMPAPSAFKPDALPPVKRKLSISEYRKRKQQSSGGSLAEPEPSSETSAVDKSGARDRSDSASSGTSSLSSDEEGSKMSHPHDLPGLTTLPLFTGIENDEKKGLTAEAILKARKVSPPHSSVSNTPPTYPLPQLPPQPYIPPPGSAPIHYPPFQSKPAPVLYSTFTLPQITTAQQPVYGGAVTSQATGVNSKQSQQSFLIPQASQAPPGSNPYPPHLTVPTITKFTSATPPPPPPPSSTSTSTSTSTTANQAYPVQPPGQPQKPFFNHPASRS
ncbi:Histone-lysine N-methyltransferase MLL5 [Harpegnathos saltator]|uniref:Histone-lysine N-methyltransferase MLL5 n=1 Tax=Harpegnathos saltator TaxID=610380 RepID=E2B702_HARSA|nr:Histone-lysine N-methyltransferase MLL5 [Harpegnathos saltator]